MIKKRYIILALIIGPIIYSMLMTGYAQSNIDGEFSPSSDVEFIYDMTYKKDGEIHYDHSIYNTQLDMIDNAEEFLIIDLFLYNDEYDRSTMYFESQVEEMSQKLVDKKKDNPNMDIVFITDELNNFYGAYTQQHIQAMIDGGIDVTITDPDMIRDSNPIYSGLYRAYIKWFGSPEGGWIKNIFDPKGPEVTVRSFLRLLNFKANHRKVLISEKEAMVTSANPHDPSSLHSNVAIRYKGRSIEDLIKSELGLVDKSYPSIADYEMPAAETGDVQTRVITEQMIYKALVNNIEAVEKGDSINIGIFYIADTKLLKELSKASDRGVEVNIIADQNKDAFGLEKNGTPNRPALSELVDDNPDINVRWYETSGEQFHTKLAYFDYQNKNPRVILGSANFTRRNLQNYNLETDLELLIARGSDLHLEIDNYYNRMWNNVDGDYTSPLSDHYEDSKFLRTLWKVQEKLGLCTW